MAIRQPSRIWHALRKLALFGVIAALGLLNWQIWTKPQDIRPIALDHSASTPKATSGAIPSADPKPARAKVYTETLARPIFRADRKPFVAAVEPPPPVIEEAVEAPQAAPPVEPPQGLKLVGVMRDNDGQDRALVRSAQTPAAAWLGVGDEIDGWRVSEITQSGMTLSADASSVTLNLYPTAESQPEAVTP